MSLHILLDKTDTHALSVRGRISAPLQKGAVKAPSAASTHVDTHHDVTSILKVGLKFMSMNG